MTDVAAARKYRQRQPHHEFRGTGACRATENRQQYVPPTQSEVQRTQLRRTLHKNHAALSWHFGGCGSSFACTRAVAVSFRNTMVFDFECNTSASLPGRLGALAQASDPMQLARICRARFPNAERCSFGPDRKAETLRRDQRTATAERARLIRASCQGEILTAVPVQKVPTSFRKQKGPARKQ